MASVKTYVAHINARVRGMKSDLLSSAQLDAMIDKADPSAMADTLLTSPYEVEMAEALTRYAGADAVEDAASRNLVNTFAKLRLVSRGKLQDPARIFVSRWDLAAAKSLLRRVHHGIDAHAAQDSLLPGPSMPVAVQEELANHNSMEALVRGLAAWNSKLCHCLLAALPNYQQNNDLSALEEVLDRNYFSGTVKELRETRDPHSKLLTSILRLEIDRINLRNVLMPRAGGQAPEEVTGCLLHGGSIPMSTLSEMAAASTPEPILEMLGRTRYAPLFEDGIEIRKAACRFSNAVSSWNCFAGCGAPPSSKASA